MRQAAWLAVLAAIASSPTAAQQAPANPNVLPPCSDPSITTPTKVQTQISLSESYPPLSVVLGEQGKTKVVFTVKSNGTVENVQVASSSGFLRLDDATVNAVRQLLYSPPKAGDADVSCRQSMIVVWKFSEDDPAHPPNPALRMILTPPRSLYPPAVLARHEEGFSEVAMFLGRDGSIVNARVARSSNNEELNAASIAYVKTLDLKPGSIAGTAAPTMMEVTVIWTLSPPANPSSPN